MRRCSCLLVLAFALPAAAQTAPRPGKRKPAAPAPPVLVFERTPCEGTCPVYTARIFADGRVAYQGQYAVPVLGQRTLHLPTATVAQLLAEAQRLHFEQFKERYAGTATDMPSTVVTVHRPGQPAKTVSAEAGVPLPQKLEAYLAYLGKRIDPLAGL